MPLPDGRVLVSRDFKIYRPIHTPLAVLTDQFFKFLASHSEGAFNARSAFYDAYLSHPHPDDIFIENPSDPRHVNERIREALERNHPRLVLAQGAMSPYGLLHNENEEDPNARPNVVNVKIGGGNFCVDPHEVIFLSYSLHQTLSDSIESDPDLVPAIRLMAVASMAHETAHWFALSGGGHYQHDPTREVNKVFGNTRPEFSALTRRDWGTDAVEKLFGHVYEMLTYADGTIEVVSSRVLPIRPSSNGRRETHTPCLSLRDQMSLIGANLPATLDITRYRAEGRLTPRAPPPWRERDGFLLLTALEQQAGCHHGACRLRPVAN